jgi:PTS system N-acetylglucosamine-specific IIC component
VVADQAAVGEAVLRALGAKGIIRPSAQALQVVLGPVADSVAAEIRAAMMAGGATVAAPVAAVEAPQAAGPSRACPKPCWRRWVRAGRCWPAIAA